MNDRDVIPDLKRSPATASHANDLENWGVRRRGGMSALGIQSITFTDKNKTSRAARAKRKFDGPLFKNLRMPPKGWKP